MRLWGRSTPNSRLPSELIDALDSVMIYFVDLLSYNSYQLGLNQMSSMTTEYRDKFLPPQCYMTVVSTTAQKNPYHSLKGTSTDVGTFRSEFVKKKRLQSPVKAAEPPLSPGQLASRVEAYTSVYKHDFRPWNFIKQQPHRPGDSPKVTHRLDLRPHRDSGPVERNHTSSPAADHGRFLSITHAHYIPHKRQRTKPILPTSCVEKSHKARQRSARPRPLPSFNTYTHTDKHTHVNPVNNSYAIGLQRKVTDAESRRTTQHNGNRRHTAMRSYNSYQLGLNQMSSMTTEYRDKFLPPQCYMTVVSTTAQKNPYHSLKGTSTDVGTFRSEFVKKKRLQSPVKAAEPPLSPGQLASRVEAYTSVYKHDFRPWNFIKQQPHRPGDSPKVTHRLAARPHRDSAPVESNHKPQTSSPPEDFDRFLSTTHADYIPHKCQRTKPILPVMHIIERSKEPFHTMTTMRADYRPWNTLQCLPVGKEDAASFTSQTNLTMLPRAKLSLNVIESPLTKTQHVLVHLHGQRSDQA
ncbi:hypothetical protein Q8A73_012845 [Channa argus]|nr:hypothetical protein Q8A73_012845 [Channa argus]